MIKLTVEEIKNIHTLLINETGGLGGLRDEGLLESAINSTFQTFDKNPLYTTIEEQAAHLTFSIIKNHAFIDGNKRVGIMVLLVFLECNGIYFDYSNEELIHLGLSLANGNMSEQDLVQWLIDKQNYKHE